MTGFPRTDSCFGELLDVFEPREGDVFVSTSPKCGQTWLLTLLYHLKTGARDATLDTAALLSHCPWLEARISAVTREPYDLDERRAELDALPSPRVFKMHALWEEIPVASGTRVLTITRDPRDVPFSMFAHKHSMPPEIFSEDYPAPPRDFGEYFQQWLEVGFYFDFMASMWAHHDDPNVMWLRYEDMRSDLGGTVRKLLAFLQWKVDQDAVKRAMDWVTMKHMAGNDSKVDRGMMPKLIREGASGVNRSRLTDRQEETLLETLRGRLPEDCVSWLLALEERA